MYFNDPIVRLFAIRYLSMYVYSLFANIILSDTIYLLKFLRSCFTVFMQHNSYSAKVPETKLTILYKLLVSLHTVLNYSVKMF